tara:strand:+ start:386 stop:628 length:243 start_codon:yes stop_codon:yes gene_type:complete
MGFKLRKPNPKGIVDANGFRNNPDIDEVIVNSGDITMTEEDGAPLEAGMLSGTDNLGNTKLMKPGENYKFPGNKVIERKA